MPVIKKEGKDTIIFATKEDHATPSKVDLPEPEPSPGLILPNGEINWNCPCLGGMATGPCGLEFREAFSCFHYSNTEPRGSDCYGAFKSMQECMVQYPSIYKHDKETEDELEEAEREMDELERLKKEHKSSEGNVEQVKNTPSEPVTSNEKEVVKAQ